MPWVRAICPGCSGKITVDNTRKSGVCEYCGYAVNYRDAITNYNTNYNMVFHGSGATAQTLTNYGVELLKSRGMDKARDVFEEALKLDVKWARAWLGLAMCDADAANIDEFVENTARDWTESQLVAPVPNSNFDKARKYAMTGGKLKPYLDQVLVRILTSAARMCRDKLSCAEQELKKAAHKERAWAVIDCIIFAALIVFCNFTSFWFLLILPVYIIIGLVLWSNYDMEIFPLIRTHREKTEAQDTSVQWSARTECVRAALANTAMGGNIA